MSESHVSAGEFETWRFQARLVGVVDGDTVDVEVDLGFGLRRDTLRLRIAGVNTAETYGVSKDSAEWSAGMEHKSTTTDFLQMAEAYTGPWPLVIETEKETGKYGRYIADIQRKHDDEWLVAHLLDRHPEVAHEY